MRHRTTVRRRLRATAVLGEAAGTTGLIGGQVLDLESEGRAIDAADARAAASREDGRSALGLRARRGAARRARARRTSRAWTPTASAIGLAFQVVDDVLDGTADAAALGKTAGKDAGGGQGDLRQRARPRPARARSPTGCSPTRSPRSRRSASAGRILAGLARHDRPAAQLRPCRAVAPRRLAGGAGPGPEPREGAGAGDGRPRAGRRRARAQAGRRGGRRTPRSKSCPAPPTSAAAR